MHSFPTPTVSTKSTVKNIWIKGIHKMGKKIKKRMLGALEGGGTKFICAVGTIEGEILQEIRIPTTTPDKTLAYAARFFKQFSPAAIGLGSFGPLDLNPDSPSYGCITATPKSGWAGVNLLTFFQDKFDLPISLDLDVNVSVLGEHTFVPENSTLDSMVYFTIGTGIGAGFIADRRIIHGLTHPEAGHIKIPHDLTKDPFPGVCPFHNDCFEGLASGPAISARWGQPAESLPEDHPAWDLEVGYIASALVNIILILSPQRIILGGGVMENRFLFPPIRERVIRILNNYLPSTVVPGKLDSFIIPPALSYRSGILGAIAMARDSLLNA